MKLLEEPLVAEASQGEARLARVRNSPLVLWHLLSLDAPAVAVVWTMFTARMTHTAVPLATGVAMGLAVWLLYAADRLLDTRALDPLGDSGDFEARHFFHHRHRAAFGVGMAIATLGLALLLPRLAPDSIHLYLTEGALMAGYFVLIHATPLRGGRRRVALPKELMVGPFFAAATFIPTVARNPDLRMALLPDALLFAGLCCLNCLYIYAWEHPRSATEAHWTTHHAVRRLSLLAGGLVLASLFVAGGSGRLWPYATAVSLSTLSLLGLDGMRAKLARPALRAAADAVLLTPLLLLPVWIR